ncbi:hypothetical protein SLA2020_484010 [Shorea laevis]
MASHTLTFLPIAISTAHLKRAGDSSVSLPVTSLLGKKLLIQSSNLRSFIPKHHSSPKATVAFSVETSKQERNPSERLPNGGGVRWSARAIKAFAMGELEARKIKYPDTGTEAILMGILVEATSVTAKFLRDNGITLFKVQDEILNLLGKADVRFTSPEHPPLTEQAQKGLDWAVEEKLKSGESGEITTTYLLLGVWAQKNSAGHKVLAALGFNDEKAKELEKFKNQDFVPSFK